MFSISFKFHDFPNFRNKFTLFHFQVRKCKEEFQYFPVFYGLQQPGTYLNQAPNFITFTWNITEEDAD